MTRASEESRDVPSLRDSLPHASSFLNFDDGADQPPWPETDPAASEGVDLQLTDDEHERSASPSSNSDFPARCKSKPHPERNKGPHAISAAECDDGSVLEACCRRHLAAWSAVASGDHALLLPTAVTAAVEFLAATATGDEPSQLDCHRQLIVAVAPAAEPHEVSTPRAGEENPGRAASDMLRDLAARLQNELSMWTTAFCSMDAVLVSLPWRELTLRQEAEEGDEPSARVVTIAQQLISHLEAADRPAPISQTGTPSSPAILRDKADYPPPLTATSPSSSWSSAEGHTASDRRGSGSPPIGVVELKFKRTRDDDRASSSRRVRGRSQTSKAPPRRAVQQSLLTEELVAILDEMSNLDRKLCERLRGICLPQDASRSSSATASSSAPPVRWMCLRYAELPWFAGAVTTCQGLLSRGRIPPQATTAIGDAATHQGLGSSSWPCVS